MGSANGQDLGLKFLEIEQLLNEFLAIEQLLNVTSELQRKVFISEITNETKNPTRQGQNILKVSDGFDQIVSEVNQHHVDSVESR